MTQLGRNASQVCRNCFFFSKISWFLTHLVVRGVDTRCLMYSDIRIWGEIWGVVPCIVLALLRRAQCYRNVHPWFLGRFVVRDSTIILGFLRSSFSPKARDVYRSTPREVLQGTRSHQVIQITANHSDKWLLFWFWSQNYFWPNHIIFAIMKLRSCENVRVVETCNCDKKNESTTSLQLNTSVFEL